MTTDNQNLPRDEFFTVFPDASESDWKRWNGLRTDVEELESLIGGSELDRETQERIGQHVANAKKFLRFEDEYTILMVGSSRVGKSTLVNALQGRDLIATGSRAAVTGTVITVLPISRQGSTTHDVQEQALIYYHTSESLIKLVKQLGLNCVYTGPTSTPQEIDIPSTLKQIEVFKQHTLEMSAQQFPEAAVARLRDILDIFQTFTRRGETPGEANIPKRKILLDESGLQELREICDQHSSLNENEETRIIPLIDRVEYRIHFSERGENRLAPALLMDVPGAGALNPRDYLRLKEQVNSPKTRAFVLVTTQAAIAGGGIDKLVTQVRNALLNGLSNEPSEREALKRLLIVINKADELEGQIGGEEQGKKALKELSESIHPKFLEWHGENNVFRKTKALAALLAHLMQKHPEEGHNWLEEDFPETSKEKEEFQKKYPVFGKFNPSYYRRAIELAKPPDANDREECILSWSQVPDLSQRLNEFLGANRLTQDYDQARNYYRQAVREIDNALLAELEGILPPYQRAEARSDPIQFINRRVGSEEQEDRLQIAKDKERISLAFERACANVEKNKSDFVDAIANELKLVLKEANKLIEREITSEEFYQIHFGIYPDPERPAERRRNGNEIALIELRSGIDNHLDQQSPEIAAQVWFKFQEALAAYQVKEVFKNACYEQQYTQKLQERFETEILKQLKNDYLATCHAAILALAISHDAVEAIIGKPPWSDFGQSQPVPSDEAATNKPSPEEKKKIAHVQTSFTQVHNELQKELPNPLYYLFRRRMLKDKSKIEQLAEELYVLHLEHLVGSDEQKKEALIKALRAERDQITTRLLEWKTKWEEYRSYRGG